MDMQTTPVIQPRRPLLAAFMSLILPGFGQLYNGEIHKAIWLFLGFALLSLPAMVLVALYLPASWMLPTLILSLLLILALWLYGIVDAFWQARKLQHYEARAWQGSGVYALILILCSVVALPLLTDYINHNILASFRLPSESMSPSVLRGDIIFADKRYNKPEFKQAVKRGDIAIFVYPNDRTTYFIKRIIGLPGDKIRIQGADIFVNDKSLRTQAQQGEKNLLVTEQYEDQQWQVQWQQISRQLPQTEMIVPNGEVFVLGDNRSVSRDSRYFGTVPLQDVVGKAKQIWFSFSGNQVRWQRMGKILD